MQLSTALAAAVLGVVGVQAGDASYHHLARAASGSGSGASGSSSADPPKFTFQTPSHDFAGVQAQGPMGPTNPDKPELNTPVNQTSMARLATLNSIEDWCTFGPSPIEKKMSVGDNEADTVAYCTKPRNNARVIPDGTIKTVSFIQTPLYVQLHATGDFTSINFKKGDTGGELDPHGATGKGNPVGGNVTSNVVDGKTDVSYQEWMNYASSTEVCFRICIAGSSDATPAEICQHTLDEVGCSWIMPQQPSKNDFETCDADAAYPPGLYPQPDGHTSTFQQYNTGEYTANGETKGYTNGASTESTPTAAYSIPKSSNCKSQTSPSNGIKSIVSSSASAQASGKGSGSGSGSGGKNAQGSSGNAKAGSQAGPAATQFPLALALVVSTAVLAGALLA